MAHPLHHAESSARKFGGVPCDYQAVHDWFDASKEHLALFTRSRFVVVVHRRAPAARGSADTRAAERAAGRYLWATATFSVPLRPSARPLVPRL